MASQEIGADLKLDNQLCFTLYSTSLLMTKFYKPLLKGLGLTYPQYLVLLILWQEDGLSAGAISRHLMTDTGSLTPVFKRLEADGLLRRVRSRRDERVVELFLTEQGRALQARAQEIPDCVVMASGQPASELVELKARLEALREKLQEAMP
ncbi:MarR family transcriptional regulator [Halomonas sp. MCCC 1A17488]|uniref:MarR family transcriptional regulator n=1 Tax=Billgrantia sulfidoxydans TaxID=2733484 RepID=A0ABX7W9J1_9GAMM|nr:MULTISPECIES: MarR family transcriptional regulator [Halomonas]MCE8015696.1 MarR family transcriptional regulator [Halomonas sp. MCCC 1A17488]MCG3239029.1 MarR family transcriptional regulator [Halomonas sp. MCCC 1A17488]QPP51561.1 MarR family transcriptional regulator [Halomonas sp. SS10-MC5]QTP57021.1 MarR family transcriptional regulator [Halomonas sulfidoxydans]